MKKALIGFLVIGFLIGTGASAWYLTTKQTSVKEELEPEVGDFTEKLETLEVLEELEELE